MINILLLTKILGQNRLISCDRQDERFEKKFPIKRKRKINAQPKKFTNSVNTLAMVNFEGQEFSHLFNLDSNLDSKNGTWNQID